MFKLVLKIAPVLFFWGAFVLVIYQVPYPQTLASASPFQLISFFIPLFLAVLFSLNLFLKNVYISSSVSLGIVLLLLLRALDSLNMITTIITITAVGLLISYFRKASRRHLTKLPKIPKLTSLRRNK